VTERDVAAFPGDAEDLGIRSTPTIIVRRSDGSEVFRSPGVPTRDQLLLAVAKAVD
jgi:thioredoxin-related protein